MRPVRENTMSFRSQPGTVLIMVVFVTALLSAVVIGLIQINTEEIQIAENHLHAAEALALAEAGWNDALARLRAHGAVSAIPETSFAQGVYSVSVAGTSITACGKTAAGYTAQVGGTVTVHAGGPPYAVDIDTFRVNE